MSDRLVLLLDFLTLPPGLPSSAVDGFTAEAEEKRLNFLCVYGSKFPALCGVIWLIRRRGFVDGCLVKHAAVDSEVKLVISLEARSQEM